ncbi:flagellar biosynthesis anti-sigma factor FlgM [Brucella microti]|uniref:flagellar biosynthesis anti-sigma factor FlgM n=1 Tax=Brucella microti TaxID=444163 RepID=UPI0002D950E2|nr:flagellar biosynthesis anti-sigma factor FlgM [Brucella microti]
MFNRSEIMKAAWAKYRAYYAGLRQFFADGFRSVLRMAWSEAKGRTRAAAMPAQVREERIAELRQEIEWLSYKPWSVDITERRRRLNDEIGLLAAVA